MPDERIDELVFDKRGFLVEFSQWHEGLAESLAKEDGLELTECHWNVVNFLREYYEVYDTPPSPRIIIKAIGTQLTSNARCTRRTLEEMFPAGGCKQACRIAGLPDYYCHSI